MGRRCSCITWISRAAASGAMSALTILMIDGDRVRRRREHDHADRAPRAVGRSRSPARASTCTTCSSIRRRPPRASSPARSPTSSSRGRDADGPGSRGAGGSPGDDDRRQRRRSSRRAPGWRSVLRPKARWTRRLTSSRCSACRSLPAAAGRAEDDTAAARVVVITRALADKVFGEVGVVGKHRCGSPAARHARGRGDRRRGEPVAPLLRSPHRQPTAPQRAGVRAVLDVAPSSSCRTTARMQLLGRHSPTPTALGRAVYAWLQLWVELDSWRQGSTAYRDYPGAVLQRREAAAGRFQRPPNVRLRDTMAEWLDLQGSRPERRPAPEPGSRSASWLVCLINTVGLLLTKFLRRSIRDRRAPRARRLATIDLLPAPHRVRR